MKISTPNTAVRLVSVMVVADFAIARYIENRTLFLSTYSEDLACSNVVYARIDNARCPDTSICTIHNDDDGSFHDTEMTACITDRDAYLKSAFKGAPYLTVELYPADCFGKAYNTRSFLADGECHPYAHSHFKVVHNHTGTTAVWSTDSGCESTDWYEEWSVVSATDLNTESCITDGVNTWKSYLVEDTADTTDSVSNPAATEAPVTDITTSSPTTTTAAPTTDSTVFASSAASTSLSLISIADLLIRVILFAASAL